MKIINTRSHKSYKKKVIKNNQKTFLLTLVFIIGMIFGALTIRSLGETLLQKVQSLIENYYCIQTGQSIFQNFLSTLSSEFLIILIPFTFGLCIIGEPVMWIEPAVRGLGVGLISGYLYKNFSISGMGYFAAIVLIPTVLSSAITIIACQESILMTRDINRCIKNINNGNDNFVKLYLIRYAVLLISIILISILSSVLVFIFANKFSLFS